eukprot:2040715-Lingulodinium_polyedra.AAC.1
MPEAIFKPPTGKGQTTCCLRSIVSEQSEGWWAHLSAESYRALPCEMHVMFHCSAFGQWHRAAEHWRCQLMAPGTIVRRADQVVAYMVVGHLAGLGPSVQEHCSPRASLWFPQKRAPS